MNVLQAIEELQELKDKIKVLEVTSKLIQNDMDRGFEYQTLVSITDEYQRKVEMLENRLKSTQLANVR